MMSRVSAFGDLKDKFHSFVIFNLLIVLASDLCKFSMAWQYVKQVFTSCDDLQRKKQFCYILGRHVSLKFSFLHFFFVG